MTCLSDGSTLLTVPAASTPARASLPSASLRDAEESRTVSNVEGSGVEGSEAQRSEESAFALRPQVGCDNAIKDCPETRRDGALAPLLRSIKDSPGPNLETGKWKLETRNSKLETILRPPHFPALTTL